MKLNESGSGPRFDPGQVHQMRSWDNYVPPLNLCNYSLVWQWKISFGGPEYGFDRARSKDMDNTVGDDCQSSKTITANAANDEVFALAA